jgi:hypothetical protein
MKNHHLAALYLFALCGLAHAEQLSDESEQPFLGVELKTSTDGVYLSSVHERMEAGRIGLRVGDRIVFINGRRDFQTDAECVGIIQQAAAESLNTVVVRVERDEKIYDYLAHLGTLKKVDDRWTYTPMTSVTPFEHYVSESAAVMMTFEREQARVIKQYDPDRGDVEGVRAMTTVIRNARRVWDRIDLSRLPHDLKEKHELLSASLGRCAQKIDGVVQTPERGQKVLTDCMIDLMQAIADYSATLKFYNMERLREKRMQESK